jgi:predicted ATPase/DNA-binding winged helix-turn-helix (wHTH) protein
MDPASEPQARIAFGRVQVLPDRREVLADGQPVKLGGRAFDVLLALIEARGTVVSKDALMARVWPGQIVEENSLTSQISALRSALGTERALIRTVAGRGYQFTGEIHGGPGNPGEPPGGTGAQPAAVLSPTNVPGPVSELIGRDAEIAEVLHLIDRHRLVTLVGTGGIGKTRLALTVARRVQSQLSGQFPDGVWLAEFSSLADPDLVPATIAAAVGLQLGAGEISPQLVSQVLANRRLFLILDTCEHVIDAAAAMAEALLRAGPGVRIIATSREPLRAEGEQIYPVPPLAVPAVEGEDPWHFGAVLLFVMRSHANGAHVVKDKRTAPVIVGICRRLDGIPLAIELAAARAATLGVAALGSRLDDRFRLLTGGQRTALPRHQTLQAMLDWSYELLTETERVVLRRFAVFAGLFNLAAVRSVVASSEIPPAKVVDRLSDLVAKSLVVMDVEGTSARYRLLDTTRAYARAKLDADDERERLQRRHAEHYRDLFERAEAEWETRPATEWLRDYSWRIDNLRAALDWAFSPEGDASIGVALTAAALPLWMHLSLLDECRRRAEQALAACDPGKGGDPRRQMKLYAALASSSYWGAGSMHTQGAVAELGLGALWTKELEIAESLDDAEYQLRALWGLCGFRLGIGDFQISLETAQRFRTLAAKYQRRNDELIGERIMGLVQHFLGDQVSARRHTEHMLANFIVSDQRPHEAIRFQFDQRVVAGTMLARILWLQGFPDEAMATAKGAVEEARAINHPVSLCHALTFAACPIMLWVDDLAAAEHYVALLLAISERYALPSWGAMGRTFQGVLAIRRGDLGPGLRQLRVDFDELGAVSDWISALLLNELAAGFARAGRIADGFAAAEQAIARAEQTKARWLLPELLRIKGELLLLQAATGATAAAEDHFRQALDWARRQDALSLELRAATSLARLLRDQGRSADARGLLRPVYERFTEGFATTDLRAARVLLDDL